MCCVGNKTLNCYNSDVILSSFLMMTRANTQKIHVNLNLPVSCNARQTATRLCTGFPFQLFH